MPREAKLFTDAEISQIEVMAGLGMPIDQIASVLCVSKATFDRRQKGQPGVSEAVLKGRAKASIAVRKTAFEMAKSGKHPVMTIFWLKVREGWKEDSGSSDTDKTVKLAYAKKQRDK